MSDELLRLILTATPTGGLLLFAARYVWRIQAVITARFEHVLQVLRQDIVTLERELAEERSARRRDNEHCDRALTELRRRVNNLNP